MSARKLFNRHTDYLNLTGIVTTSVSEIAGKIWVEAEVTAPMTKCPHCDAVGTLTGDGVISQRFWDIPNGGKPLWVTLQNPLYKCAACHKYCQHYLSFLSPQAKLTIRLVEQILSLIDAGYTCTDIARITGPDESTIRRVRDSAAHTDYLNLAGVITTDVRESDFYFPEKPSNAFTESMVNEVKSWERAGHNVSFEALRRRCSRAAR
jgi:transposase-like protein